MAADLNFSKELEMPRPLSPTGGTDGYLIGEDSTFRKAISCIPVLGVVMALFNEFSLAEKIRTEVKIERAFRLIDVKNHYKMAGMIRELLFIAIITTLMATGVLRGTIPLAIGGVSIAVIIGVLALHGYRIRHNKQLIEEIAQHGVRQDMEVK